MVRSYHRAVTKTVFALVLCVAPGIGCSSDDAAAAPPKRTVKDRVGRTCAVDPSGFGSCDRAPTPTTACTASDAACFVVSETIGASGAAAMCAACCYREGTSTAVVIGVGDADCALITCTADAGCPEKYGRCVDGQCRK